MRYKQGAIPYLYTLHGQIRAEETLEVTIAYTITWDTHIEHTTAKGNKKLDFFPKRKLKINNPDN